MNQETFLRVAKAYEDSGGDHTPDEEKKEEEAKEVEKGDELIREPSNLSSIMERLDGIEKCNGEMRKSIDALYEMANPVEKSEGDDDMEEKEEKKEETVEKAAPVVDEKTETVTTAPEFVVKAELSQYITKAELADITKAHDDIKKSYEDLKTRVEKMEKETIEKGGHVVVIQNKYLDGKIGNIGNLDAIGA